MPFRTASLAARGVVVALAVAAVAACSDPSGTGNEPTMETVAGSYRADESLGRLTTAEGETTTDWLVEGAFIRLELRVDGTTAGRLFIPGAGEDGEDIDADLAGEWSISDRVVQLSHEADTFLRDLPFSVHDDRLEGNATFGETWVRAELVRDGA